MKKHYAFILLAHGIFTGVNAQYTVSPIPHQVYVGSLPVQGTSDDHYATPLDLPFSFNFYGQAYNQVSVGTNGVISFNVFPSGTLCPWSFNQTIPNVGFPVKNAVLGPYHDINNSDAQGTITHGIYGQEPYRRFVVIFDNQSHFQCNDAVKSTFQIILHETLNMVDVQIVEKETCATWQGGVAVLGLINVDGTQGIAAPGRNTGAWTAFEEGWRFNPGTGLGNYHFVKCDADANGFESFNLAVIQNDLSPSNPDAIVLYETMADAEMEANALQSPYMNMMAGTQTIYATGNGMITPVVLQALDCSTDYDQDTVPTDVEDINGDGNLANDDTDGDGIPDFLDNDDDGDLILSNVEYVFGRALALQDTDGDGTPNYLDNDDDGDGVLTIDEDYDNNNNPLDDDTNVNGIPDYLEESVALGVPTETSALVRLYPNPASTMLNVHNTTNESIKLLEVYSVNGVKVMSASEGQISNGLDVSQLSNGIYFVRIDIGSKTQHVKFVKN